MNFLATLNLQNYYLNPYSIAPLLVGSLTLILGFFLYFLEGKSSLNRSLLYYCGSSSLWMYSCVFVLNAKTPEVALFWAHLLFSAFILTPVTLFHLSIILPDKYKKQKPVLLASYCFVGIFILLSQQPYFLMGVKQYYFGYFPKAGMLQIVTLIFFTLCIIGSLINLIFYHYTIIASQDKRRVKLFILCFVLVLFGAIDILASYQFYLYPSGFVAFFGFIVGITCFKLLNYYNIIEQHSHSLENEVRRKTREITRVLEELKATQFKLLETGKTSALASLSAGILHQISQPITAIHGFAKFIRKEMSGKEEFYKPVCHIEEQSVYLKEMLEDLMNLIRHREIKKSNVNVNDSVKRAMHLLNDELRIRRVTWDMNLGIDLPPVYADSIHLQQIFMNIIVNSAQALSSLPKGKERYIKITSSYDSELGDNVIVFTDTGIGLTSQEKEAIFEPFFSTKAKGTGIGLALCKDLIAEHEGNIYVDSQKNKGTKFTIRLPAAKNIE